MKLATIEDLLTALEARGQRWATDGRRLLPLTPRPVLTDRLAAAMARHRPLLLRVLPRVKDGWGAAAVYKEPL